MVTYRTDRLDVIAGGRFESTDYNSTSRGDPANNVDGSFDNFLPSVNVSYDLADGLVLRAAYSRSLGRPNPGDLTQTFGVTSAIDANNDEGLAEIRRGNPNLEPRESDNFDLSIEKYFLGGEGLVSAAIFQKDIDGDIYASRTVGTYTGADFASDNVFSGDQVVFVQRTNASSSKVRGLEVQTYLGSMPFLPEPLQPLGISANATFLDGEMTLANGTELDKRIRQADFMTNLALFYNTGDYEARIAYNYTDDFPIRLSETSGFTRVDDSFEQIDASFRYYYSDNIVFSVEGRNLTDEDRTQLTGDNLDLLFGETILGRQFHFGVAYRY
jgi:TonB-dependent receptor